MVSPGAGLSALKARMDRRRRLGKGILVGGGGGGVPVIFSGLCLLCFPETSAPGGAFLCADAQVPRSHSFFSGWRHPWRLQLEGCTPHQAPEVRFAVMSCAGDSCCPCIGASPLAS